MRSMRLQRLCIPFARFFGQAVAYAPDGVQIRRAARVWLDLLADHANVHIEGAFITVKRRPPDAGEQELTLDDALGGLGQEPQNIELARRDVDDPLATRQSPHAGIDAQRADRENA